MTATGKATGHWLWVTTPEFYAKEDGSEKIEEGEGDGWWTCSRKTCEGDLALLYRTAPRKDIAYLFLAKTDAFSIGEEEYAAERDWQWACEYDVLYKFADPIPLKALRATEDLWTWGALRGSFQGRSFIIMPEHWDVLIALALPSNPRLAPFVGATEGFSAPRRILAERQLEEFLVHDLGQFRKFGWDLDLWSDPRTGRSGRQFVCAAADGRIDLLCRDRRTDGLVVVELKNVLATESTYMQTWGYVGWVQRFLARGKPVKALVVARGCDSRFAMMADASDGKVSLLSLSELERPI